MTEPERLYTVAEVASILRIAVKTVLNLLSLNRGDFRAARYQRIGRMRGVRRMLDGGEIEALRKKLVKDKMASR